MRETTTSKRLPGSLGHHILSKDRHIEGERQEKKFPFEIPYMALAWFAKHIS
jgi:hypothetical protein